MTSLLDFALSMSHPSSRDLACRECGSAFSRKPGPGRDPHFCSPGCRTKAQNRERLQKLGIRTCARCQGAFTPRDHRQRYCSKSCASSSHWDGKPREPKPPTGCRAGDHTQCDLDERHGTCSECAKTIRLGWSSAPPELRRCRDCQRAHPRHSPKKPLPPRVCELCECTYIPKYRPRPGKVQRWCSKSCTTAWANGARPPYVRVMEGDSESRKIARNRRRLRVRARTWDGVSDEQILERDRWRCGICHKVIGKSFKYPHPRSKSIDHVVPLSQGGDDTAANKRAAHLRCNQARMNRGGGEQLAMIG